MVKPIVREMDEKAQMHQTVITGKRNRTKISTYLKHCNIGSFENGFMGVEVPEKYGGPGSSFFDTVIVVEELAKV